MARLLSSSSKKYGLPWHRVVNKEGRITINDKSLSSMQKSLLLSEGIKFHKDKIIDLQEQRYKLKRCERNFEKEIEVTWI